MTIEALPVAENSASRLHSASVANLVSALDHAFARNVQCKFSAWPLQHREGFLGVMVKNAANQRRARGSGVSHTKVAITLSNGGQGGVAYHRPPLFATHDLNIAVNWKADAVNCKVPDWTPRPACMVVMIWFDGAEISGKPLVLA